MIIAFQKDFPAFEIDAWGSKRHCFLRARVFADGYLAFFCSNVCGEDVHEGTNVTGNVEVIFETAVQWLVDHHHLTVDLPSEKEARKAAFYEVAGKTRWVEHTVHEDRESYACVMLQGEACWNYLSKKSIARLEGLDLAFVTPFKKESPIGSESALAPSSTTSREDVLDAFFQLLKKSEALVVQGRSVGVDVCLSEETKTYFRDRFGEEASAIVSNCRTPALSI